MMKSLKSLPVFPVLLFSLILSTHAEKIHKVKSGEHLNLIAEKYGTTAQALQKYNGISNPNLLKIGQSIKIPGAGEETQSAGNFEQGKAPARPASHTVEKGDTFFGIANKYGLEANELKKANPKLNPDKIYIGQKIMIPGGTASPETASAPQKSVEKSAEKKTVNASSSNASAGGDTASSQKVSYSKVVLTKQMSLAEFAKEYKMTIDEINDANGWNYEGETVFDVGSQAYVIRR